MTRTVRIAPLFPATEVSRRRCDGEPCARSASFMAFGEQAKEVRRGKVMERFVADLVDDK